MTDQLEPRPAGMPLEYSGNDKSGDHLSATLFLAALLHGVLIMGVTFTAGDPATDNDRATSLEVVILTSEYENRVAPEEADMLAEQNLIGAGNTSDDVPVRIAYGDEVEAAMPGAPQEGSDNPEEQFSEAASENMLLYSKNDAALRLDPDQEETEQTDQMRMGLSGDSNPTEIMADPDQQTRVKSKNPRELVIAANTRESTIATYLEGWKRKIERVGTMNYPTQLENVARNPVLEVAISSDGTLKEVVILQSSGQRKLDQSAVNILKIASPFDPFPDYLKRDYDVLRFSYEWYFTGGERRSKLSVSEKQ